jgi:hypothetical protein
MIHCKIKCDFHKNFHKKTLILGYFLFILIGQISYIICVQPETEIDPSQDTFLSISGISAEPNTNYGQTESLDIGYSTKGHCVAVLLFDLSNIHPNAIRFNFYSWLTVNGAYSRILKIGCSTGINWNET